MLLVNWLQAASVWFSSLHADSSNMVPSSISPRHWVDIWGTAHWLNRPHSLFPNHPAFPRSPDVMFVNSTIRQTFRVSHRAEIIRVRISNQFSPEPLLLSGASIAVPTEHDGLLAGSPNINPNTSIHLSFSGYQTLRVPAGADIVSDPITFPLNALSDVSVSLYLSQGHAGSVVAGHQGTKTMSWIATGDHLSSTSLDGRGVGDSGYADFRWWYYVSSIEALLPTQSRSVICFGDSITDQGQGELPINTYPGWPDQLSRRLQATPATQDIVMVNMGISGDMIYEGGLVRLDRDIIQRHGVSYLMILMGVNDLNHHPNTTEGQIACYDHLIFAFSQFIDRAHEAGLPVFVSTILPYLVPPDFIPSPGHDDRPKIGTEPLREGTRQKVNKWIRRNAKIQAVFDLDAVMRDPEQPQHMRRDYGGLDYVHPSAAGLKAMGDAIDLRLFELFKGGISQE